MGLKVFCVVLTSAVDAAIVIAGAKIGLNPDCVGLAVLLAGCAEAVQVVCAEEVKLKRLPPAGLSAVDNDGRARVWAKAEGMVEGAVDTVGCGVAVGGSFFTVPKLKAVEVTEEGAWTTTDVAGAINQGITITSVSSQTMHHQLGPNLNKYIHIHTHTHS